MSTKARKVHGAKVEWSTDGTNWANVPELKTIAVPEVQQSYVEVTNLDSPGGFREYIPGLLDVTEFSVEGNYTSALMQTAVGYRTNGTLVHFRVTLPLEVGQATGDVLQYTAYVNPSVPQNEVGDTLMLSLNLRTSGEVTYTVGTAA